MGAERFRVGDWLVCPDLNEIRGPGARVHLEPKTMDALVTLARRPGEVVSRATLLAEVWPGTHVAEGAVFRVLSDLRRALGDDARTPVYVQTIPRRGYRLVATVTPAGPLSWRPSFGRLAGRRPAIRFGGAALVAVLAVLIASNSPRPDATASSGTWNHDATAPAPPPSFAEGQVWEDRADCAAYGHARQSFERALLEAPGFQPATLHLVDSYTASAVIGCLPTADAGPRIDALLADAPADHDGVRRRRASATLWFGNDQRGARQQFDSVPSEPDVSRAALYLSLGAPDRAIDEAWRAWREAPAELGENFALALVLLLGGRPDDALARFDATLDLYPGFPPALHLASLAHLERGDDARAADTARAAIAAMRAPIDRFSSVPLLVLRRLGHVEEADHALTRWRAAAAASGWVAPTAEAIAALADGDRQAALDWMSVARETRDPWMILSARDPLLAGLDADRDQAGPWQRGHQ